MNFHCIAHLDTFAVIARLHKQKPAWQGEATRPILLLRHHNDPSAGSNWLEDLPLHDSEIFQKWSSLKHLLAAARRIILDPKGPTPQLRNLIDRSAPAGRVMLSALNPETILDWHTDSGPYHDRHIRFHIPLLTNPLCGLQVRHEIINMAVGSLWWCNHRAPHTAWNFGTTQRVHIVFELPVLRDDAEPA